MNNIIRIHAGHAIGDPYQNGYEGHTLEVSGYTLMALRGLNPAVAVPMPASASHTHVLSGLTDPLNQKIWASAPESPEQYASRKKEAFEEFMAVSKMLFARDQTWKVMPVAENPLVEFFVINEAASIGVTYRFPADEVTIAMVSPYIHNGLTRTVSLSHWTKFCRGEISQL
jgi:hypothetical protein